MNELNTRIPNTNKIGMASTSDLTLFFKERFTQEPIISSAPGRINLIGEHTDYNNGYVLPASIDKITTFALAPNGTNKCNLYSYDLEDSYEFDCHTPQAGEVSWANYIIGVVAELKKIGADIQGFNCIFSGDVPIGSGLSSSASLECALAAGLNKVFQLSLEPFAMVKACQMAEHHYAGVRCGIMDQFISMLGKEGQVLRLDCRSLDYDYYPLELGEYCFILCNTKVSHSLASSEYNIRREQCEKGVELLKKYQPEIESLRDVDANLLEAHRDELGDLIYQRCHYVISENQRVLDTCNALEKGNLTRVGELLYQSHEGLSKEYEVSCPELDLLVDFTQNREEVLGARMMGGGFGGCTLNLVKKSKSDEFIKDITAFYLEKTGKQTEVYSAVIGDGAYALSQND